MGAPLPVGRLNLRPEPSSAATTMRPGCGREPPRYARTSPIPRRCAAPAPRSSRRSTPHCALRASTAARRSAERRHGSDRRQELPEEPCDRHLHQTHQVVRASLRPAAEADRQTRLYPAFLPSVPAGEATAASKALTRRRQRMPASASWAGPGPAEHCKRRLAGGSRRLASSQTAMGTCKRGGQRWWLIPTRSCPAACW
jgi:hypothetical protein